MPSAFIEMLNDITAPAAQDTPRLLTAVLADKLGIAVEDIPEQVGVAWVADAFGLDATSVQTAIRRKRLPATKLAGTETKKRGTWLIRPGDALLIWGYRLDPDYPTKKGGATDV